MPADSLTQGLLALGIITCCNDPLHPCPPPKPIPSMFSSKLPPKPDALPQFFQPPPVRPINFAGFKPPACPG